MCVCVCVCVGGWLRAADQEFCLVTAVWVAGAEAGRLSVCVCLHVGHEQVPQMEAVEIS